MSFLSIYIWIVNNSIYPLYILIFQIPFLEVIIKRCYSQIIIIIHLLDYEMLLNNIIVIIQYINDQTLTVTIFVDKIYSYKHCIPFSKDCGVTLY